MTLGPAWLAGCTEAAPGPTVAPIAGREFVVAGGLTVETAPDGSDRPAQPLWGEAGPGWHFRFDASDVGEAEAWFALAEPTGDWTPIQVPAAWDLAHPEGFDRQTAGWYHTTFDAAPSLGGRVILRFEGVFREATVWLNGERLGGTDLPYLPFSFDVTNHLVPAAAGENVLVVRVDNRLTETSLPCDTLFHPGKHGWFPYGGLIRPVWLEGGLETRAAQVLARTDLQGNIQVDVHFLQDPAPAPVATLEARLLGPAGKAQLVWPLTEIPQDGAGLRLSGRVPDPQHWSPDHPAHRYRLALTVHSGGEAEATTYEVAFRRLEARDQRFWLNGEDFYLRGINRHEDHPDWGPIYGPEAVAEDVSLAVALGANFCRPGHYPNDLRVLRALEEAGIGLAEEVPVYQWDHGQMGDPEMVQRARRALEAMILRDFNRPAILMWSIANEIHSWADTAPAFVQALYDAAKALDPDRPVMVAAVSVPLMSEMDASSRIADVVGINEYQGWYVETTDTVTAWLRTLHAQFPDRTVFVSEYGAGALLGRHADGPVGEEPVGDHSYSEEYQAWFHARHIAQFRELDFIRGFMPWVLADFRMQWSPTTGQPHPVENMNLKGLCSDRREPKLAFETVQQAFSEIAAGQ